VEAAVKGERGKFDAKILEALKIAPFGISQIGISEAKRVSYASVVNWLTENGAQVRTEGERKGKRVFFV
jgi:hypothetical protein